MHRLLTALLLAALVGPAAARQPQGKQGQLDEPERMTIRKTLGVPESTRVEMASAKRLPAASPLKIFQGAHLDAKRGKEFATWVEKWNAENGERFGRLEVVSDEASADAVVLYGIHSGAVLNVAGRMPADRDSGPLATALVRSYILVRSGDGLEIVFRETRMLLGQPADVNGDQFDDWIKEQHKHFEKLMRERAKPPNR